MKSKETLLDRLLEYPQIRYQSPLFCCFNLKKAGESNIVRGGCWQGNDPISLRTADVFPVVASLPFLEGESDDRKYVCGSQATIQ